MQVGQPSPLSDPRTLRLSGAPPSSRGQALSPFTLCLWGFHANGTTHSMVFCVYCFDRKCHGHTVTALHFPAVQAAFPPVRRSSRATAEPRASCYPSGQCTSAAKPARGLRSSLPCDQVTLTLLPPGAGTDLLALRVIGDPSSTPSSLLCADTEGQGDILCTLVENAP